MPPLILKSPHLPPFFDKQKMFRLAVWFQLVRVSNLKPHVYKGFDLYKYVVYTLQKDDNAAQCRHSCRNATTPPLFDKQKMCRLAVLSRFVKASDLKPHLTCWNITARRHIFCLSKNCGVVWRFLYEWRHWVALSPFLMCVYNIYKSNPRLKTPCL